MSENSSNHENENDAEKAAHDEHPKPKYDDVNMPVVVLLSVLSAILTFVIIAFVQGLYYSWLDSMVQQDWNSRIKTPQEQVIADQKSIRNGFYETEGGEVYVSVDVAAKKLIDSKGEITVPAKASNNGAKTTPEKADSDKTGPAKNDDKTDESKPGPPGPDSNDEKTDVKKQPGKTVTDNNGTEAKDPTKNETKEAPAKEDTSKGNEPVKDVKQAEKTPEKKEESTPEKKG